MAGRLSEIEQQRLLENCSSVEWSPDGVCPCCGHTVVIDSQEHVVRHGWTAVTEMQQVCEWCSWESDIRIED